MDASQIPDEVNFGKYVAVADHSADHVAPGEDGEHVLDVRAGDVVYVLEQDETGWFGCRKEGDGREGWLPGSILRCLEPAAGEGQPAPLQGPAAEVYVEPDVGTQPLPAVCCSPPPAA